MPERRRVLINHRRDDSIVHAAGSADRTVDALYTGGGGV
jgi:hypothetical protein